MSMSAFSLQGENELKSGYVKMEFVPFYSPTVMIYDRKKGENIGSAKLGDDEPKKGVYVLVETELTWGRYKISVGLGGVNKKEKTPEGEQQTLLGRVKYHASNPPEDMEKWDKAILICDWEVDIENRAIEFGSLRPERRDVKISEAIKSEVHLLEKMLHAELMQFTEEFGSLKVYRNRGENFKYFMPNPDNERYEYYIGIVMESLQQIAPNYDKPRQRKHSKYLIEAELLDIGETIYGRFDSIAVIKDEKGNIEVTEFYIKNKKSIKKDLLGLQDVSLRQAALAISEANEIDVSNVDASKFWKALKDGELIKIEDLGE